MGSPDTDKVFTGSIPKLYETYLVPLIFEPYAADLANRLSSRSLSRVLEIAAGTGVVARALASVLPESVSISEARRVLRPGGVFIFNVWDRIKENEFADIVTTSLESLFPKDPPHFMARTPHGYHDRRTIERDLSNGGFTRSPRIDTVGARSRAASPRIPAIAYCQGTPLRNEIETRGAVDGKIQTHIVTIES
jgi:hypothetical protein